jgi:hypothetical protein
MLEQISSNNALLAIIIRKEYTCQGVEFLTSDEAPMQVGVMCHPQGHEILPHLHVPFKRTINNTQEVLWIRKGKLRVDFYDEKKNFLESRIVGAGDTILIVSGGHGFTVLEELEMIEAKTGPFIKDSKTIVIKDSKTIASMTKR